MKPLTLTIVACIALLIAGCGGDDGSATNTETTAESSEPAQAAEKGKPTVTVPEGPPPAKLEINDLTEGSGAEAKAGDEISVHYVGVGYKSGKEFDASWDRGEPLGFQLGVGTVIKGWDQGIEGMKVGGRRELVIPSDLAYGPEGSPSIAPNEPLIFVVDLLAINGQSSDTSSDESGFEDRSPKPAVELPEGPPPTELVVEDIEEGDGEVVKDGDTIVVDYVGVNYKTGKEFESTWDESKGKEGRPAGFEMDSGKLIKGWEQGIEGMRVGGRRELIIPSELAFKTGVVIYIIDLLGIQ